MTRKSSENHRSNASYDGVLQSLVGFASYGYGQDIQVLADEASQLAFFSEKDMDAETADDFFNYIPFLKNFFLPSEIDNLSLISNLEKEDEVSLEGEAEETASSGLRDWDDYTINSIEKEPDFAYFNFQNRNDETPQSILDGNAQISDNNVSIEQDIISYTNPNVLAVDGLAYRTSPDYNELIGSLVGNAKWQNDSYTYAFRVVGWSDAEKDMLRKAVDLWNAYTPLNVSESQTDTADFYFYDFDDLHGVNWQTYPPFSAVGVGGAPWVDFDIDLDKNGTTDMFVGEVVYDLAGLKGWPYYGVEEGQGGFRTFVHEVGHLLGLAHPHDSGGNSEVMPKSPARTYYNSAGEKVEVIKPNVLDDGRATVMSYYWQDPFVVASTPMAIDIAAIQTIYGEVAAATGNNRYNLSDVIDKTYKTIWDTGGTDEIYYVGMQNITIDLRQATLKSNFDDGSKGVTAGGYFSGLYDRYTYDNYGVALRGGYYIAGDAVKGGYSTVIENASGGSGNDLLNGNYVANLLKGYDGDDKIYGFAGNDYLYGYDGNDYIKGGNDNDTLYGGLGDDALGGDDGNDRVYGEDGNDWLYGQSGNDYIRGGNGNDTLYGGVGDDALGGDGGNDRVYGEDGNDKLYGQSGDDYIRGGNGNDYIVGGLGDDALGGDNGNDRVYGEDGNDRLYGQSGNDYMRGGNGNDTLYGGVGDDALGGDNGNDRIYGENGNDRLYGQGGNDYLDGGSGNDYMRGGNHNDRLIGRSGHDRLYGDNGNDVLYGNEGYDALYGGYGLDYLYGGADNDRYYFSRGHGKDYIRETNAGGRFDRLYLDFAFDDDDFSMAFFDGDRDGRRDDLAFNFGRGDRVTVLDYAGGLEVEQVIFNNEIIDVSDYLMQNNISPF